MKFRDQLIELGACRPAINWVGDKSLSVAWGSCKKGDWLLWLAAMAGVDRKTIVLAACDCAELADKHLYGKTRVPARNAIATARAWCRDEATTDQVRRAADAAYAAAADAALAADAARAASAAAATDAAATTYATTYAATYAADAADAATYAADAATYAATYAADADADADARDKTLEKCAAIVRRHISTRMIIDALAGDRDDK